MRLGQEGFAGEKVPRFGDASPHVIAVSERSDRLYWRTVNDDLVIAYGGGSKVVNAALEQFPEAEGKGRDVVIRPGLGQETTFEGGIIKCDMTFHAPSRLGLSMLGKAKTGRGESIFESEPTLTVYISEAVPLKALHVPASLRVLELDDLRERFVVGLSVGNVPPDATKLGSKTPHEKVEGMTVRAESA